MQANNGNMVPRPCPDVVRCMPMLFDTCHIWCTAILFTDWFLAESMLFVLVALFVDISITLRSAKNAKM